MPELFWNCCFLVQVVFFLVILQERVDTVGMVGA